MTPAERERLEHLEKLTRRYRKRIIELKAALNLFREDAGARLNERLAAEERDDDRKTT